MKPGNAFLLHQQYLADAAARQMIGGGGTGETRADDDIVKVLHAVYLLLRVLSEVLDNSKGWRV